MLYLKNKFYIFMVKLEKNNLQLGYPEGNFSPKKYYYDPRKKGRGPFIEIDIEKYIDNIEDYYVHEAYSNLLYKCKSFNKKIRNDLLLNFLYKNRCDIEKIIVYGHSCEIDFDYFQNLNFQYPYANWSFFVKGDKQENSVARLINLIGIANAKIFNV